MMFMHMIEMISMSELICKMATYDNTTEDMTTIGYISHWKGLVKTKLIMENLIS